MNRRGFLKFGLTGAPAALITRKTPEEIVNEEHPNCPSCKCWDPAITNETVKENFKGGYDLWDVTTTKIMGHEVDVQREFIKKVTYKPSKSNYWEGNSIRVASDHGHYYGATIDGRFLCQCRCHDDPAAMWAKVGYPMPEDECDLS